MKEHFAKRVLSSLEGAGDVVVIEEAGAGCVYCSDALQDVYGYDRETLNAAGGLPVLLADAAAGQHVRDVLQTGGTFEAEVRVQHRKGRVVPSRLRIDCTVGEEDAPLCATAVLKPLPAGPSTAGRPGHQVHSIEHRLRVEGALIEATHMLVSHGDVDFEQMLGIVGEAIGAECAYLITLPPDDELVQAYTGRESRLYTEQDLPYAPQQVEMRVSVWHRGGRRGRAHWVRQLESDLGWSMPSGEARLRLQNTFEQGEASVLAVPVLSPQDKLYGYLGLEYGADVHEVLEEDIRVLSVLGDMLSAYFERSMAAQALQESEERWRLLVDSHPEPIVISVNAEVIYINRSGAKLLGSDVPGEILGYTLFDFVSAEHTDQLKEDLQAVRHGNCLVPQERDLIRLDGEERIVEWFSVPIVYKGQQAVQSVLRDITQRKRAERALQQSEERYRSFVETISEAIWRIELEEPVPVRAALQDQIRGIYKQGTLAECNQSMARMLEAASETELIGRSVGALMPFLSRHLIEEFIQSGYRLRNREYTPQGEGMPPHHLVVNAVGTLEEGRLVRIWGSCVDVTERVELERQIVTDLERQQQQIGRDLHDGVGQFLTGVRMLSNNLAERFFAEADEGFVLAHKVVRFAEEASRRVREIYTGLAPVQLYEDGLSAALEELAAHVNALPNMSCQFRYGGGADVADRQARLHLYRIAQEATNNALKHARARQIEILLGREQDQVVLQVTDDGVSFDVKQRAGNSLGLRSMYYRARTIGATFQIHSQPGSGTTVRCMLPMREESRYLSKSVLSDQEEPYL